MVGDGTLNINTLRQELQKTLPDYMIPSYFVRQDEFPLTPNGKIDRKALPDPTDADIDRTSGYAAARDTLDERLIHIWQDVLQIDSIGVHDNFFELGGHSLKAMQVVSRILKDLGTKLPLRTLFTTADYRRAGSRGAGGRNRQFFEHPTRRATTPL